MVSPLRQRRIKSGLLLLECAERIGKSEAYLSQLERGLVPKIDRQLAARVVEAYGASFEELDATVYGWRSDWPEARGS